MSDENDMVNHPSHYVAGRQFEPFAVLSDWFGSDPLLWNATKYLSRAGRKGDMVTDLRKAAFFIAKAIEREELKK